MRTSRVGDPSTTERVIHLEFEEPASQRPATILRGHFFFSVLLDVIGDRVDGRQGALCDIRVWNRHAELFFKRDNEFESVNRVEPEPVLAE